jgi:EAL domain-containing protein (putative c-di-GMP-specific phosphodiesterase class I)
LQAKYWQDNDGPVTHIAVNLSSRQFLEGDLFGTIRKILDETHLKSSSLELEITESAVMQDPDRALIVLRQLHDLGVPISIDDFGTGYSNLTYLRRFPIQRIKIDRSFIADIPDNRNSMTLVQGIIALAHELKLQVTVEGVETEEQLAFLIDRQCDFLQGYLFSPPMTADRLETEFRTDSVKTLVAGKRH